MSRREQQPEVRDAMKAQPSDGRRGTTAAAARSSRGTGGSAEDGLKVRGAGNGRAAKLSRGEEGQTTVIMVLFLATFLLGFGALAIDVESLFQARRQAQAAADAAAVAAAEEFRNGTASENAAAYSIARLNGFDRSLPVNPATVLVGTPTSGSYLNAASYLQVTVSRPVPIFFAGILTGQSTVIVGARAVAGFGQGSPTCVCLEGASGNDLNLSNRLRHDGRFDQQRCGHRYRRIDSGRPGDRQRIRQLG
jgi:hypothetical protein